MEKQLGNLRAPETVKDPGACVKRIQCKGPEVWVEKATEGRKGLLNPKLRFLSLPHIMISKRY